MHNDDFSLHKKLEEQRPGDNDQKILLSHPNCFSIAKYHLNNARQSRIQNGCSCLEINSGNQ